MIKKLRLTVLMDDQPGGFGLLSEHGLSFFIEADDFCLLFDTGQSGLFLRNAESLRVDLHDTGVLVLSHGHYDHTGGLADLLSLNHSIQVYCNHAVLLSRYSRQPDRELKSIGIPKKSSEALNCIFNSVHLVSRPTLLTPDIGITGFVQRHAPFENTGGLFYLDQRGQNPDLINDDLSMWFKSEKGLVIVTGCCHSGLVNTVEYIMSISKEKRVFSIIGGLHLLNASGERLEETCRYLKHLSPDSLYACHCTGTGSTDFLRNYLPFKVENGRVGLSLEF